MPLATITQLEPFNINNSATFTFASTSVTANVSAGNVKTDNLLYANGSAWQFSNYANTNVAAYLPTYTGNITGNIVTLTGNVTAINASLGNLVTANYFTGTLVTGAQPNITSLGTLTSLTSGLITATTGGIKVGNIQDPSGTNTISLSSGNITVTSNVTATYFIGNGSQLTGLPATYSNTNVAAYLPTYTGNITGNIVTLTGNVTAINASLGNLVTANYFTGTLTTAAQPNITSVGTLTSLTVTANITAGNANVTGTVSAANITTTGSSGNITGANVISANLFTGTLTTGAQPNITSTGTLASLTVTANISSGNANLGNLATANYFTGTLTTGAQPNITSVGSLIGLTVSNATGVVNFTTTANVTLGAVGNLHITGGTTGQYLKTDGSGGLSWADAGNATAIINGNSNVVVSANSNVTFGVSGNAAVMTVTGTGVNVGGYLTATGALSVANIVTTGTTGNITGANWIVANYFSGAGNNLSNLQASNISGQVGNSLVAGTVYTNAQPNITSVGTLSSLTVTGDSTITGNLTVTGTFEYANVTSFKVKDPIIEQGGNPNGTALASNDGYDRGQLLHYYSGAVIDAFMGWDNSNAEFAFGSNVSVASEVVTFNTFGNVRAGYFLGNGSQLTGTIANANYAAYAGNVVTAAQPNITSVGTLASLTVTGNISSGNANLGNLVTANYFTGNGSLLTSLTGGNVTGTVANATYATSAGSATTAGTVTTAAQPNITSTGTLASLTVTANISSGNANLGNLVTANFFSGAGNLLSNIAGGNVTGQVANALVAGTVYTNAQPNITSVGTLTSVTVTGNVTAGNVKTDNLLYANGTAWSFSGSSNIATIPMAGVQVFTADGTGNTYTLTATPVNSDQISVNIDGVVQLHTSFSLSGNVVTLSGTPVSGAKVEITNIAATSAATTGKAIAMAIVFGF